jgi:tRNA U34 5-methylaminomethyl-2-thiouridine-forming methyltransferase MnmC
MLDGISDAALTGFGTAALMFIMFAVGFLRGNIFSSKQVKELKSNLEAMRDQWKEIALKNEAALRLRDEADRRVAIETARTTAHAIESIQHAAGGDPFVPSRPEDTYGPDRSTVID